MDASLAAGGGSVASGTTGLGGVLASLVLVLLLIVGIGWLVSRMRGIGPGAGGGALRVAASMSLGLKERIVLVEAAGAWLLLSVVPGKVRVLHRYERQPEGLDAAPTPIGFSAVLERLRKPGASA